MGVFRQSAVRAFGRCLAAILVGTAAVLPAAHAQTVTLFDNFGPGDSTSDSGQPIRGNWDGTAVDLAIPFSTDASGYLLTQIVAPIQPGGPPPANPFILQIRTDNGGIPSSTILASLATSEVPSPGGSIVWNPVGVTLSPNATYWLAALAGAELTNRNWLFNNQAQAGVAVNQTGLGWIYAPFPATPVARITAIRLSAVAVPEPGTLALIGLGLLGAALVTRSRKTAPCS